MADEEFKSINDLLLSESKSISSGDLPFPSYGAGWGYSPIYRSEAAWDAQIDSYFSTDNSPERYRMMLGDLSRHALPAAAARFLGDALPEAPLLVKERKDPDEEGRKGKSVSIPNHKAVKLWERPNDFYDGVTMLKGIALSLVLTSNAYLLKFFNNANLWPVELWWEPHWTIRPVWPTDGSQFISYYEVNRNGIWYPIDTEQVIHIRDGMSPYNQRLGFDTNYAVSTELFGDAEAGRYYASLMGGSGVPGFAISIDKDYKGMTPKTIEAFERRVVEKTTGAKKGQPLVMQGARPYKLGFNPRELDLRETRYMAEDRFCSSKGIPAVVLELGTGIAHSIYNNVKEAQERAWRNYVCPKLTLIEKALDLQLLEDFEGEGSNRYCRHDLSEIQALQEDEDNKSKRIGQQYADGIIMKSEARSALNYGPSDPSNPELDKVWGKLSAAEREEATQKRFEQQQALRQQQGSLPPQVNTTPEPAKTPVVKKPFKSLETITWALFSPHLGSLGIPRTSMPQVLSAHRGAMVQFLRGRGVKVTKEEVYPWTLKPAQAEYSPEKVSKAKEWAGTQRPLLISEDSYVADGHHQWAAALDTPEDTIPVFRIASPIIETLLLVSQFPSSGIKDDKDKAIFWNGNGKKSIPGMRAEFSDILPDCEVSLDSMDVLLALLATDRILTFASEFPKPASLLKKVEMLPADNKTNLAYVAPLSSGGYRMVFNSDLWTDSRVMAEALTETIGKDEISITPVDTVESTIDHELAHILDSWIASNKNGNKDVGSNNPVWNTEGALTLSRYSLAGPAEAFAEAFAIRQGFGIEKIPAGEIRESMDTSISFASGAQA